jgi:hypothetical protein
MKASATRWLMTCAGACLVYGFTSAAGDPSTELLTPKKFTALHSLLKPQGKEERWTQIPWLTSLWQARERAAAEGKPILLWEMDGHPLGCT